ncbi:hypothetical protein AB0L00_28050 [Actinoallomurus sp. NPDC052308]|uniref:hypothetical protein n=1 Tax=Actinoallomurus sp. NPDC052308 TaxID=3155530 RepID=UPI00343F28B2
MSTREEKLQQSLAEFYALLDSMRFTGASQVVEVQHLKVLVSKYPEQAWYFVAGLDQDGADAGSCGQ